MNSIILFESPFNSSKQNNGYSKNKAVYQYSKDKKTFIKKFDSATIAGEELNIFVTNISNCLNGRYKSSGGYFWSFHSF